MSLCDASSPRVAVVVGFASCLQHEKAKSSNATAPTVIAPLQKENHAPNITNDFEARGLSAGTTSTLTMNNLGSLCKDEGTLKEAEQALKGKGKAWGLLKVATEVIGGC